MMRCKYGFVILCSMVFLAMGCTPVLAGEYVLDEIYMEDDYQESYMEGYSLDVATSSDATPSDADYFPVLYGSYDNVYNGSYSSTYVTYFSGIVERLSPTMDYVFFRQEQYGYRLVYSTTLSCSGSSFTADDGHYVYYDTRYGTVTEGEEGDFSLEAGAYPVYTSLDSMYPVLVEGVRGYEFRTLIFIVTLSFVFGIVESFLRVGKYRF